MKRFLSISLFLLLTLLFQNILFSQLNQDWKWVHPKPQGNVLRNVQAFSGNEWIVAGYNGTFMHTTNAGTNWDFYTNAGGVNASGLYNSLYDFWFFNPSTGLVCGANGYIARTTNSGMNWVTSSSGRTVTLNGMHFINASTGFIGCADTILKTTNGGLNWTPIPLGVTASVNNIFALDANHIYAPSSSGNLYVTINGGANWVKDSTGSGTLYDVNFIDASTGFVCGSSGAVRLTINGGANWTNVPTGVSATYNQLFVTSSTLRASLNEDFNGATFPPAGWTAVNVLGNTVLWSRSTTQFHSSPSSALIPYDCDTAAGGLDWLITPKININSGDSLSFWLRSVDFGYPPDSLCIRVSTTDSNLSSFTNRILYLADGLNYPDSGVWQRYSVSLNSFAGQNIFIGFKHQDICGDGLYLDDVSAGGSSPSAFSVYVVGDTSRIFKTDNLGSNWTAIPFLDPAHKWTNTWYAMSIVNSTIVVAGANGTFNVSTNDGTSWTEFNKKISGGTLYDVWCEYGMGKVWAVGAPGKTGVFDQVLYSSNGGATFINQDVGTSTATFRSISMANSLTGYICGTNSSIRKTTNGGTTWDTLSTSLPAALNLYKIDFVNANSGWVFSNTVTPGGTIWHTTNGGGTWTQQALPDTLPNGPKIYSADMVDGNTGFCTNGYSAVYLTTNAGANWIVQNPWVFFGPTIGEVCMVDANTGYLCGSTKLFRTYNQFAVMDSVVHPLTGTLVATRWTDINNGFILNSAGLTARTTNRGETWDLMPTSVGTLSRICLQHADTGYVVGSGGTVLKLQKGFVGITWQNNVPGQYFLGQNYPNPFNPETQFKFGLSTKGKVSLKIYDITGRLVQTLFDNMELNPGTLTVKFDGRNFASGVYFYTLLVDDNRVDTRKMVLLK